MIEAWVTGVGVRGPGLDGWASSRAILTGEQPYEPREVALPPLALLSSTERRRAGPVARLAMLVAAEACEGAGLAPGALRSVFGSSNGDGAVVTGILEAVSGADQQVSPTQFHNSVHNAAAGYWSIGTGSAQPATCLGAYDGTFAASLLKAMAELRAERAPVLLCVYDAPLPEPLARLRPTGAAFGVGLVLTPDSAGAALARLRVAYQPDPSPAGDDAARHPGLSLLSQANPAARALRLLEALARREPDAFSTGLAGGTLRIEIARA